MPEPSTIARAAFSVAKALFVRNEDEESGTTRLIIGVAIGVVVFFVIFSIAIEIFVSPAASLLEFFSSDSIAEAKASLASGFSRPVISAEQKGLIGLPVIDPTTSSPYGWRFLGLMGGMNFHEGLDFPVAFGSSVMAVAPGKVVGCGVSKDYGDYIMLKHHMVRYDKDEEIIDEEEFYSFYAHLYKRYVFMGQTVAQGQEIAVSGGDPALHFAGNSTGAHLHLELRETQEYASHFDPYNYVLKPDPFKGKTKSIGWRVE